MSKIITCDGDKCPHTIDLDIVTDAWHEKVEKFLCDLCRSDDDG